MKSNLVEQFDLAFQKYKGLESFEMKDLISDIKPNLVIDSKEVLSDLITSYMQNRLRPLVNSKDYYSTSKGHYTAFENLSVDELDRIIKRRNDDIMQREKSLQRFKKRKTEIDGQLTIVFDGIQFAGYQEIAL